MLNLQLLPLLGRSLSTLVTLGTPACLETNKSRHTSPAAARK